MPTARAARLARRCTHPSGKRSRFMVSPPPVLSAVQLFAEKHNDRDVEVAMKGRPIEAWHLRADLRYHSRERLAARGEEREMIGSLDEMSLRPLGPVRFDEVAVPPVGLPFVVFSLPQLHRRP